MQFDDAVIRVGKDRGALDHLVGERFIGHGIDRRGHQLVQDIEAIATEATAKGITFPECPRFELQIDNGDLYAVEVNSMVTVPLGKL